MQRWRRKLASIFWPRSQPPDLPNDLASDRHRAADGMTVRQMLNVLSALAVLLAALVAHLRHWIDRIFCPNIAWRPGLRASFADRDSRL
jgi:hypothetical protein